MNAAQSALSRAETNIVTVAGSTTGCGESFGIGWMMQRLRRAFAKYLSVFD
jgi:hypothetical protein